jgi:hypothetical protein
MHVLSGAVASLRSGGMSSTFSGLDAGLATIARRADEAAGSAFEKFQLAWGGEPGNRILTRADELGRALKAPPAIESRVASQESHVTAPDQLPTRDLQLETSDPRLGTGNSTVLVTRDS